MGREGFISTFSLRSSVGVPRSLLLSPGKRIAVWLRFQEGGRWVFLLSLPLREPSCWASLASQTPAPPGRGGIRQRPGVGVSPAGGPAPGPGAARGQGGEGHGRCLTVDASGEQSSPLSAAGWLA